MAKDRDAYHVAPDSDGGWKVKKKGDQRASGVFDRRSDAVGLGKELAKKAPLGQIKIHKQDGKIQTEHTYGKDPHHPKG